MLVGAMRCTDLRILIVVYDRQVHRTGHMILGVLPLTARVDHQLVLALKRAFEKLRKRLTWIRVIQRACHALA
jgi:hypothetical protein